MESPEAQKEQLIAAGVNKSWRFWSSMIQIIRKRKSAIVLQWRFL